MRHVQAPAAVPALSPVLAPAPGPSTDRVINLSLNLAGAGLSNLTMQNAVAIREALADQLHLCEPQPSTVPVKLDAGSLDGKIVHTDPPDICSFLLEVHTHICT